MYISTLPTNGPAAQEEAFKPKLVIKSIKEVPESGDPLELTILEPNNVVSFKAGASVEFNIEVLNPDGTPMALNKTFALPLAGEMGTSPRIVDITFKDGKASLILGDWRSGRWRITAEEVNIDLSPEEGQFDFSGLIIKVRE